MHFTPYRRLFEACEVLEGGGLPLLWAREKHVSPFCATTILLQLLARPLCVGIGEDMIVEDVKAGVFVMVADAVDTPT